MTFISLGLRKYVVMIVKMAVAVVSCGSVV